MNMGNTLSRRTIDVVGICCSSAPIPICGRDGARGIRCVRSGSPRRLAGEFPARDLSSAGGTRRPPRDRTNEGRAVPSLREGAAPPDRRQPRGRRRPPLRYVTARCADITYETRAEDRAAAPRAGLLDRRRDSDPRVHDTRLGWQDRRHCKDSGDRASIGRYLEIHCRSWPRSCWCRAAHFLTTA